MRPAIRRVAQCAGRCLFNDATGARLRANLSSKVFAPSHYMRLLDQSQEFAVSWLLFGRRPPGRYKHTGRRTRASRTPTNEERALNSRICQAKGPDELLRLADEEGHCFRFSNMTTCINRLSKLPYTEHDAVKRSASFLRLMQRLEAVLHSRSAEVDAQGLANIVNGLAKLEHRPGEAFVKLLVDSGVVLGLESFTPQGLATVINGLVKLGYHPGQEFLELFTQTCMSMRFSGFTAQDLALTINGLVKLGSRPTEEFIVLFVAACEAATFSSFKPQELSVVIDGLGKIGYNPPDRWMDDFIFACMRKGLQSFEVFALTGVIGGLAELRHKPPSDFVNDFMRACTAQVETCDHQALGTFLVSFASLGLTIEDARWNRLIESFANLPHPSGQSMTSVVWAAAAYNRQADLAKLPSLQALSQASLSSVASRVQNTGFLQAVKQTLYSLDPNKDLEVRQMLQSIAALVTRRCQAISEPRTSEMQRAVASILREGLGLRVREEQVIADGAISLDIVIVPREGIRQRPVGVEVDGPWHDLSNFPGEPTGTTRFKRRLLGLAVQRGELGVWVSVPYRAWNRQRGLPQQEAYLRELLEDKGLDLADYKA